LLDLNKTGAVPTAKTLTKTTRISVPLAVH
jgi:hypothetical protein